MTVKGFESAFDDEEKVRPLPGTMAHLKWVEDKKKREKAVDKSLLIDGQTTSLKEAPILKEAPAPKEAASLKEVVQTTSSKERASLKEGHIRDGLVNIMANFCFFDRDVFALLRSLKEAEMRIYLDLYTRSYGKWSYAKRKTIPRNICSCTNSQLSETTGITSSSAFSRAFKGLESKGLIKRLITSRSINEKSLFRVYLPCEIPGADSETIIKYIDDDDLL